MARTNSWNKVIRIIPILLGLLLLSGIGAFPQQGQLIENPIGRIPKWVRDTYFAEHLDNRYTIIYRLYPTFLKGDFNADGRRDIAIQVREIRSGKIGIAVFHGKRPQALAVHVAILGAGSDVGGAGTDLKWANIWRTATSPGVAPPPSKSAAAPTHATALRLEKRNGMKGIIYWTGKKYEWMRVKS